MCEIFGFSSSKEEELNDYLREFYSHCEEHPHGWGLAILDPDRFSVIKEPLKARSSIMLGNVLLKKIMQVGDGLLSITGLYLIVLIYVNIAL